MTDKSYAKSYDSVPQEISSGSKCKNLLVMEIILLLCRLMLILIKVPMGLISEFHKINAMDLEKVVVIIRLAHV